MDLDLRQHNINHILSKLLVALHGLLVVPHWQTVFSEDQVP